MFDPSCCFSPCGLTGQGFVERIPGVTTLVRDPVTGDLRARSGNQAPKRFSGVGGAETGGRRTQKGGHWGVVFVFACFFFFFFLGAGLGDLGGSQRRTWTLFGWLMDLFLVVVILLGGTFGGNWGRFAGIYVNRWGVCFCFLLLGYTVPKSWAISESDPS